jgi:hypothetical protein
MAYLTVAEYKTYIRGLTQGQPDAWMAAEDSLLSTFITEAQKYIETKTERLFEASTQTRYYSADYIPIANPSLLMLDAELLTVTTLTNGDATTISASDYFLHPFNTSPKTAILLKSTKSWSFGTDGRISVAGTWGYTAAADATVKEMVKLIAWNIQQNRMRTNGVTLLDGGAIQVDEGGLPARVSDWLRLMKRKVALWP